MRLLVIILGILLILVVLVFIIIYLLQKKKLESYQYLDKDIKSTKIINEILNIINLQETSDIKMNKLNETILSLYGAKYSTMCFYNGSSYSILTSNVEETYASSIKNIAFESDFIQAIENNTTKYISSTSLETLKYKSAIERGIKSMIFIPIYNNLTYIGFWIMEDTTSNAFDNISDLELNKIKSSLSACVSILHTQRLIEKAENTDKQTGLYNNIYLYSVARQIIMQEDTNTLSVICLKNIPLINENFGRDISNSLIIRVARILREILASSNIIIRYSGIKIIVLTPGISADMVKPIMERALDKIKNDYEYSNETKVSVTPQIVIHTLKEKNNIDLELNESIEYVDNLEDVNIIKVI